jgi:hypothetical protein
MEFPATGTSPEALFSLSFAAKDEQRAGGRTLIFARRIGLDD